MACFGDAFDDLAPDDILLPTAVGRFMHVDFDPALYARLVAVHSGEGIELTDERWRGRARA